MTSSSFHNHTNQTPRGDPSLQIHKSLSWRSTGSRNAPSCPSSPCPPPPTSPPRPPKSSSYPRETGVDMKICQSRQFMVPDKLICAPIALRGPGSILQYDIGAICNKGWSLSATRHDISILMRPGAVLTMPKLFGSRPQRDATKSSCPSQISF